MQSRYAGSDPRPVHDRVGVNSVELGRLRPGLVPYVTDLVRLGVNPANPASFGPSWSILGLAWSGPVRPLCKIGGSVRSDYFRAQTGPGLWNR